MNYAPFYIGQKVVAVDAVSGSVIKNGQHYIVSECYYAPSGNPLANGASFWYVRVSAFPIWSLRPSIFAPIQQMKLPLMTFTQIKEKEKNEVLVEN